MLILFGGCSVAQASLDCDRLGSLRKIGSLLQSIEVKFVIHLELFVVLAGGEDGGAMGEGGL